MRELPQLIINRINKYADAKKISAAKKDKLIEIVTLKYNEGLVSPGDAVGQIAAQSIGERGTQLTLRTKHYAGSLEVSVGSGIQRVNEIVDGRSTTKQPAMTLYLEPDYFKKESDIVNFADSLIDIKVGDVGEFVEDFSERTVIFKLDDIKAKQHNIDVESIMTDIYDKIVDVYSNKRFSNNKQQINFHFDKSTGLYAIRKAIIKWAKIPLLGIKNIEKSVLYKEDEEYVIHTKGSNLKEILKVEGIDTKRSYTNDIFEINKVFGIEAARNAIVTELNNTFVENSIDINKRHVFLLADLMTSAGIVKGVVRTGITGEKKSPFARASFEETIKHILNAAFNNEVENLNGIVENIIVGQPISAGTGTVKLTIDPKGFEKMVKKKQKEEEKNK